MRIIAIGTGLGQRFDELVEPYEQPLAPGRDAARLYDALKARDGSETVAAFLIGHPDYRITQIPARDGVAHGGIKRSNKFPNCSFFTNWTSTEDKITWDAEVLSDGQYEVELYYTCPAADVGSTVELSFGASRLLGRITEAHDPPLRGGGNDRVQRTESYVKDFKPLKLGTIELRKGRGELTLRATEIPGTQAMDFRLMMFTRVGP